MSSQDNGIASKERGELDTEQSVKFTKSSGGDTRSSSTNNDTVPLLRDHDSDLDEDGTVVIISSSQIDKTEEKRTVDTEKNKSSIAGASFNFINSIIGSGIIGIPAALQQSGFAVGLALLVLMGLITDYTVILLIKNGDLSGQYTYQDMVTTAFGRPGYWFLTFAQFFFPFFAMSAYIVIVGDSLGRILDHLFTLTHIETPAVFTDPRDILVKVVMVVLVMLPVSMLRNIAKLEKLSLFAIVFIVFIVSVTVYEVFNLYCPVRCFEPSCCATPVTSWAINKDVTQTIGIMAGAFVCHHNTYLIYDSLKQKSYKRFSLVSHISVSVSFLFCCVLGLFGFLTFLNVTQGDLLNNYCGDDAVANATRFFYSCVVMLTYPIECFVAREVLEIALSNIPRNAVSWIPQPTMRKGVESFLYKPRHKSLTRHIVLTLVLIVGTLGVAMTTNDLGVVLAFNGCLTAIPLAFIIPTACYLKLSQNKWCSLSKIFALLVMVFGIIVMIIGTVLAVYDAVQSYSNQTSFVPSYCVSQLDTSMNTTIDTCCRLYNATDGFSLTFELCDCQQLCPSTQVLRNVSEEFCDYF